MGLGDGVVVCEIPRGNYGWIDDDTLDKVILLVYKILP